MPFPLRFLLVNTLVSRRMLIDMDLEYTETKNMLDNVVLTNSHAGRIFIEKDKGQYPVSCL